tara:strand:+ start:263 stop:475 length:213 start_codon:yes stop_codon:yes gene_type:complete
VGIFPIAHTPGDLYRPDTGRDRDAQCHGQDQFVQLNSFITARRFVEAFEGIQHGQGKKYHRTADKGGGDG